MSKYKPWYALMLTGHDDSTYTDFEGPADRCNERLDQLRDSRIWDQIKSHAIVHIA